MLNTTSFMTRPRAWMGVLLLLTLTCALVACGSSTTTTTTTTSPSSTTSTQTSPTTSAAALPSVTITAKDFSFSMPDTLPGGFVDITMMNTGSQPHQAQLARFNPGVTEAQFLAALKQGPKAILPLLTVAGGPNTVDPGQSQEVILNLSPGQYVALCLVAGPDNVPHFAKGMLKFFTVSTPSNATQTPPQADGQVMLKDFSFQLPAIHSGPMLLKVTNQGPQPHEMDLLKLIPGKTLQDAVAFLQKPAGPPPFADAGGMGAINPGSSAWLKLNLTSGNYVALCFVPDRTTGKPHFALGMITTFTVQ